MLLRLKLFYTQHHYTPHGVTLRHTASHCVTRRHIVSHGVTLCHTASHRVTRRYIVSHGVTRHPTSHPWSVTPSAGNGCPEQTGSAEQGCFIENFTVDFAISYSAVGWVHMWQFDRFRNFKVRICMYRCYWWTLNCSNKLPVTYYQAASWKFFLTISPLVNLT